MLLVGFFASDYEKSKAKYLNISIAVFRLNYQRGAYERVRVYQKLFNGVNHEYEKVIVCRVNSASLIGHQEAVKIATAEVANVPLSSGYYNNSIYRKRFVNAAYALSRK